MDEGAQDRYWTVEDLRRYLRLGRTKSYELLHTKEIPSVMIGRSRRIDPHDVTEWLERKKNGYGE